MAADVVKGADRGALVFYDDQAFARYFSKRVVTRFGELALMTDQHPVAREYLLQLFSKNLWRNKVALRQRVCAGPQSRNSFAKIRSLLRLRHTHTASCMRATFASTPLYNGCTSASFGTRSKIVYATTAL